jgi:hypothetical protein
VWPQQQSLALTSMKFGESQCVCVSSATTLNLAN